MKRLATTVLFFAALVTIWHFLCQAGVCSPYVLPDPISVWEYLADLIASGEMFSAIWVTVKRLVAGYALGLVIGIPLGMLAARFTMIHDTIGVLALGLQALPSVCWVPLACIWFGQTEAALLFVVIMGTLWSVTLSTETGMSNVSPIYTRAARTMGSGSLRTLMLVTLPASAPFVVSGMKQGWAFAWRSLMAAEIYVAVVTGFGLGQHLHFGRELQRMDQVIAIMLVIIVIGLLTDKIFFSPTERWLHRRWGTGRA